MPKFEIYIGEGQADLFGGAAAESFAASDDLRVLPDLRSFEDRPDTCKWRTNPKTLYGIPIFEHALYPAGVGLLVKDGVPVYPLDWRSGKLSILNMTGKRLSYTMGSIYLTVWVS